MLTNEDNSACAFEMLHSGMVPNLLRYALAIVITEQFSIGCRKTKIKVITLASKGKLMNQPKLVASTQ